MVKFKEFLFIFLGSLFLTIGVIGIFLPLLPTTPFLILTAMCFNKGSKKFHHWLIHHRLLGPPIQDWNQHHVIRTKYKTLATLMIFISSYFVYTKESIPIIGKAVFAVFVLSVLLFIWTRKASSEFSDK